MKPSHLHSDIDARTRRTRESLFKAFTALVLTRPYADIRVDDIIQRAGIARSTFYQHFHGKDNLLTDSMQGMLEVLADAATGRGDRDNLQFILEHFWENRRFGRIILNGPAGKNVIRALAQAIQNCWQTGDCQPSSAIPLSLQATQLAAGQLAVIREWLSGTVACPAESLTAHLLGEQVY